MFSLPYYCAVGPFVLVYLSNIKKSQLFDNLFITIIISSFACVILAFTPVLNHYNRHTTPTHDEFSDLVQKITKPNDKILAYDYATMEYLLSNRFPVSPLMFYSPWIEEYNKNPILNIKADPCPDIESQKPKLIFISWIFKPSLVCLNSILSRDYYKAKGQSFYIRKDLFALSGYERESNGFTFDKCSNK